MLLGVVFDLISGVLRNLRPLERRPRMADWSDYASALYEHTGWGRGQFQKDWEAEEDRQHETALESILGAALRKHFEESFEPDAKWKKPVEVLTETPADMLRGVRAETELDAQRFLPKSASTFMREFNRLIPALEHMGYGIRQTTRGRGREARKIVEIWRKSSMPDPSPDGSVGRSAGSAACLSGEGTMQGYESVSQNSLDKGNSLVSPNGSAATVASFREQGSKNSKGRKKAHRRINTI